MITRETARALVVGHLSKNRGIDPSIIGDNTKLYFTEALDITTWSTLSFDRTLNIKEGDTVGDLVNQMVG